MSCCALSDGTEGNGRGSSFQLRPSFAPHLLDDGTDIRPVQKLLGHKDVRPTMQSVHVRERSGAGVRSPFDPLDAP